MLSESMNKHLEDQLKFEETINLENAELRKQI